ncbi:hypothetical protein Tco_1050729, partial [Tanacetum coccineum]
MSGNASYGSSWADQWDHNPEPMPSAKHNSKLGGGSMAGKYGKKTKDVAMTGAKKVKQGTSIGSPRAIGSCHREKVRKMEFGTRFCMALEFSGV